MKEKERLPSTSSLISDIMLRNSSGLFRHKNTNVSTVSPTFFAIVGLLLLAMFGLLQAAVPLTSQPPSSNTSNDIAYGQPSLPNDGSGSRDTGSLAAKGNTYQAIANMVPITNKVYYYFGHKDTEGKRCGKGFITGKLCSSKYIGGWCRDYRHFYGIVFEKCQVWPGFRARAYLWNMGIPIRPMKIPCSIVSHFKKMYRCPLTVNIVWRLFDRIPAPNCTAADVCDHEGGKPSVTITQAPSVRPELGRLDVIKSGAIVKSSIFTTTAQDGYSSMYTNSKYAILLCEQQGHFNTMLFSLTPRTNIHFQFKEFSHPAISDSSQNSQNAASGKSIKFGDVDKVNDRSTDTTKADVLNFKKNVDYYVEVGVPERSSSLFIPELPDANANFWIIFPLTQSSIIELLNGSEFMFNYENTGYKLKFDGNNSYFYKLIENSTMPIASYNAAINPYYNSTDETITIYFTSLDHFMEVMIKEVAESTKTQHSSIVIEKPGPAANPTDKERIRIRASIASPALKPITDTLKKGNKKVFSSGSVQGS